MLLGIFGFQATTTPIVPPIPQARTVVQATTTRAEPVKTLAKKTHDSPVPVQKINTVYVATTTVVYVPVYVQATSTASSSVKAETKTETPSVPKSPPVEISQNIDTLLTKFAGKEKSAENKRDMVINSVSPDYIDSLVEIPTSNLVVYGANLRDTVVYLLNDECDLLVRANGKQVLQIPQEGNYNNPSICRKIETNTEASDGTSISFDFYRRLPTTRSADGTGKITTSYTFVLVKKKNLTGVPLPYSAVFFTIYQN